MPAKAGIQFILWIPAFAGMTRMERAKVGEIEIA